MFKLRINAIADETLGKVFQKDKRAFRRVGRWRILFTTEGRVIDVWIIAIEKDTEKDYKRWIAYIAYQC